MQSFNQFQGANYVGVQYEAIQYGWLAFIVPGGLVLRLLTPIVRKISLVTKL